MRSIISTIFAIILFIFVIYLANSGSIVLPDYWTGLAVALTVTAFGILYWGFKPQIHRFFKEKRRIQGGETEIAPSTEVETRKSTLLPDSAKITELNIDDKLLDQLYEEAHAKALDIYHDAQLSYFVIQVLPYALGGSDVNIYMDFYSKWADKLCRFQYAELNPEIEALSSR